MRCIAHEPRSVVIHLSTLSLFSPPPSPLLLSSPSCLPSPFLSPLLPSCVPSPRVLETPRLSPSLQSIMPVVVADTRLVAQYECPRTAPLPPTGDPQPPTTPPAVTAPLPLQTQP